MDFGELITLDRQLLLLSNGSGSLYFDALVKILTTAATWIPLYVSLFYVVLKNNNTAARIVAIVACAGICVLLAGTVDDAIVKPVVARWRPSHDPVIGTLVDTVNGYRGGDYGFFSAHASNTFSIAVFFSLLVRSNLLATALVLWSLVNCWTRLYLGVHFPGDILCGLLWGGFVGTMVYFGYTRLARLADKHQKSIVFVTEHYTSTGYERSDAHWVVLVLVLTLLYALIRSCFFIYV